MKRLSSLLLVITLAGCTSSGRNGDSNLPHSAAALTPVNHETVFHIQTEWDEITGFNGYLDRTVSDKPTGGPLYAGDAGIAGVVAQLAAHAAINNSIKSKREQEAQDLANQVVTDYLDIVKTVDHDRFIEQLEQPGLNLITTTSVDEPAKLGSDIIVEVAPRYFMSQDESALMLLVDMSVYRREDPENILFKKTMKSLSEPISSAHPDAIWRKGEPTHLEFTMQSLFGESLTVLLGHFVEPPELSQPEKSTYKYTFGKEIRYERASLIKSSCKRLYLENLREDIVAIPAINCPGDTSLDLSALPADQSRNQRNIC